MVPEVSILLLQLLVHVVEFLQYLIDLRLFQRVLFRLSLTRPLLSFLGKLSLELFDFGVVVLLYSLQIRLNYVQVLRKLSLYLLMFLRPLLVFLSELLEHSFKVLAFNLLSA